MTSFKAKVLNDMGKFIVVGNNFKPNADFDLWLAHCGIYSLVTNDLVAKYTDRIRWFERKPGVPVLKSYNIGDTTWIHVDFSNIRIAK